MVSIGERIRRIREGKHISRAALARAAGMSYSSLADLENGYQKSTTKLHRIAEALAVTPEHLETGATNGAKPGPQHVTTREAELLAHYRNAPPDGKRAIEATAEALGGNSPTRR